MNASEFLPLVIKPAAALIITIGYLGLAWLLKSRYMLEEAPVTQYGFVLSPLAPLGLYIIEHIPYRFDSAYDRKVRDKVADLFGRGEAAVFFRIHNIQKAVLVSAAVVFFTVIGLLGEAEYSFFLFGPVIAVLLYYWTDQEINRKLAARKRQMLIDLPGFVNTLTLLISAGLPLTEAISKSFRANKEDRPLYRELARMLAEARAGKPLAQAYEDLAQRCKVPEITRFVSILLQNLNRGNADLVLVLRGLAQEAWDKRKEIARKQGEEASSKLVFPMVMVFVAITIIVLAPAVITITM